MSIDVLVNLLFAIGAVCFTCGALINLARSIGWL